MIAGLPRSSCAPNADCFPFWSHISTSISSRAHIASGLVQGVAIFTFNLLILISPIDAHAQQYFEIRVIDRNTGAAIPGVILATNHHLRFETDANGVVAFFEPDLMGEVVYFSVEREGYTYEGFLGFEGFSALVRGGDRFTLLLVPDGTAPVIAKSDSETQKISSGPPAAGDYFEILVVDSETRRGVAGVEVALGEQRFWTDSAGRVAYFEREKMGRSLEFHISSHGYRYEGGVAELFVTSGGRAELEIDRVNLAERLYRVTGGGVYNDSFRLGYSVPERFTKLRGLVMGQDTAMTTVYHGRVFWIWGDTSSSFSVLGNFFSSGAQSTLPPSGLSPEVGVHLDYFVNARGFSRPMAPYEGYPGQGVTWLGGLTVVEDAGEEALFATYRRVQPGFELTARGIARFNDSTGTFENAVEVDNEGMAPVRQSARIPFDDGYVYYDHNVRIPATVRGMTTPSMYEGFTARTSDGRLDTDSEGRLVYAWRPGLAPLSPAELERAGIPLEERLDGHVRSVVDGRSLNIHPFKAMAYNPFRDRFINILLEIGGTSSYLGELWYSEADSPVGPWVYARKIVTHSGYNFYNPRYHPFFDREGGRRIYFEGTYTHWLSGSSPTPRYDYNQIMYALNLDDPALSLPVPIYDRSAGGRQDFVSRRGLRRSAPSVASVFFAPEQAGNYADLPVWWDGPDCAPRQLRVGGDPETPPVFFAQRPGTRPPDIAEDLTIPLYGFRDEATGEWIYRTDPLDGSARFHSSPVTIARV